MNELMIKMFYSKPTTNHGNKMLILNFDDDADKYTVLQLNSFSKINFNKIKIDKNKYLLKIVTTEKETGHIEEHSFNFDDEDDVEKALQQILVQLNKAKMSKSLKVILGFFGITISLFVLMNLFMQASMVVGMYPGKQVVQTQQVNQQLPPFAIGSTTISQSEAQANMLKQQKEMEALMKKLQGEGVPMDISEEERVKRHQETLQKINQIHDAEIAKYRENREKGDLYGTGQPLVQNSVIDTPPPDTSKEVNKFIESLK